jgi:hypothetical protein
VTETQIVHQQNQQFRMKWTNMKRKFSFTFIQYRQILLTTLEQKQKQINFQSFNGIILLKS